MSVLVLHLLLLLSAITYLIGRIDGYRKGFYDGKNKRKNSYAKGRRNRTSDAH